MRKQITYILSGSVIMLCCVLGGTAQEKSVFYRIVSTQQTSITSIDVTGSTASITWTNEYPNSLFRIEWASSLDAVWATNSMPQGTCTSATMVAKLPGTPTIGPTGMVYCFESFHFNCFVVPGAPVPYHGRYVDTSGTIWGYDSDYQSPEFYYPTDGVYTRNQIDTKFSFYTNGIGKVHRSTLAQMMRLVSGAATGTMVSSGSGGNDMGWGITTAFIYSPSNDTYTAVRLEQTGDNPMTNTSPEASLLLEWVTNVMQ